MKIAIVIGTRPEIIKMAPVIRECRHRGLDHYVLHTGQHYSYQMDQVFFEQLELPMPDYSLDVGSDTHAGQTGLIMKGIERVLMENSPDVVLVQGDTNTVLAGALAASKLHIKVGHVEAGLRSYDRRMPEEINRVIADHISDCLFAPTENSRGNLIKEGIPEKKIYVTGNTIVDSVYQNIEIARRKSDVLKDLGLEPKKYFLATIHRAENVDNKDRMKEILRGFELIQKEYGLPVIFPMHPRTRKMAEMFGLDLGGIRAIEPQGFFQFLLLEANARLALTDSGGVQEETCILGVPCVTLRDNTERPETIAVKSNLLSGANAQSIAEKVRIMLNRGNGWEIPFGDGRSGINIVNYLYKRIINENTHIIAN